MSNNTQNDFRTEAFVLRRTNYGEADRILNLITPEGKISVIAKGVRREKSKLAGGVEMFSLIEVGIHKGKSELGVVTSSKMLKFYNNIVVDLGKMEFAALVLKKISNAAQSSDAPGYFDITKQVLTMLNVGMEITIIEAWFWFNLAKVSGEEVNLYRDVDGDKLAASKMYLWDGGEKALRESQNGSIGADEIKIMRLMLTANLAVVGRVKNIQELSERVLNIARVFAE